MIFSRDIQNCRCVFLPLFSGQWCVLAGHAMYCCVAYIVASIRCRRDWLMCKCFSNITETRKGLKVSKLIHCNDWNMHVCIHHALNNMKSIKMLYKCSLSFQEQQIDLISQKSVNNLTEYWHLCVIFSTWPNTWHFSCKMLWNQTLVFNIR